MYRSFLLKSVLAAVAGLFFLGFAFTESARAQGPVTSAGPETGTNPDSSHSQTSTFLSRYPWNGVNVWAGGSLQTRNASHNEIIDGQLRIVAFQFTRDVWRSHRYRLAYVGEVLPVMLVHSGAPLNRKPNVKANPALLNDPARLALYEYHDSYGFGIAPFGAEFTTRLSDRFSFLVSTTAGAALFSKVVPYGDATRANFTVSPGAALQWEVFHRTGIAFGYTFHHLSNASFGTSNPGMNSQIFFARIARLGPRL